MTIMASTGLQRVGKLGMMLRSALHVMACLCLSEVRMSPDLIHTSVSSTSQISPGAAGTATACPATRERTWPALDSNFFAVTWLLLGGVLDRGSTGAGL